MTQMLEIIDKDFKEAIIKNAPRRKTTLEMNGVVDRILQQSTISCPNCRDYAQNITPW